MKILLLLILLSVSTFGTNIGAGWTSIGAEPYVDTECVETFDITIVEDSLWWDDTCHIAVVTTCDTVTDVDSARIGDSTITFVDSTGDTIAFITPHVSIGIKTFIITAGSLSDTDYVYIRGEIIQNIVNNIRFFLMRFRRGFGLGF